MATKTDSIHREATTPVAEGLHPKQVHRNLIAPQLIEAAIRRNEGVLSDHGAFTAVTSPHTGRSAKDKFVVDEPGRPVRSGGTRTPAWSRPPSTGCMTTSSST